MAGLIFLIVLLPIISLIEAINVKTLAEAGTSLHVADPASFALTWKSITWVISVLFMVMLFFYCKPNAQTSGSSIGIRFTLLYLTWYILFSNLISSVWLVPKFNSQHLYWVNLLVIGLLFRNNTSPWMENTEGYSLPYTKKLLTWWAIAIIVILLVAYIAVLSGYANPNAQTRFPGN
ncbi:MAG: hypothetical protein QM802_23940 [Agriterribacter sp.]